jgi:hypothetical protein
MPRRTDADGLPSSSGDCQAGMSNPWQGKRKPARDAFVKIRLSPSELAEMIESAARSGMDVSKFIRLRCLKG